MSALERELRLRPTSWEPWLVYADYLSGQGDARGRLIALEHQLDTAATSTQRRLLEAEIDELRETQQAGWSPPELPETFVLEWSHGFLVGVTAVLSSATCTALASLLAHPQARLLSRVCVRPPSSAASFDDEDFDEDAEERGPPPVAEELLAELFALELGELSSLAIQYAGLDVAGVRSLVGCERLAGLRELDLRYAGIGNDGVSTLLAWPRLRELAVLRLQHNRIGQAGARALASVGFTELRTLDLRDNPLTSEGVSALAAAPGLARLEALYLSYANIGPAGARALAESPQLPFKLRRHWAAIASQSHLDPSGPSRDNP